MEEDDVFQKVLSKTSAMEIVLMALLSERREDPAFWARLHRIRDRVCGLIAEQIEPAEQPTLQRIETCLDMWEQGALRETFDRSLFGRP